MARVNGPFLSLDASGKLGNTLVASIWKGRNYMRMHFIPTNANTDLQKAQRVIFAAAVRSWQGLYASAREQWNVAAREVYPPIPGFNYYVSQYCLQGGYPTIPATAPKKAKVIHNR
ncbi:hypothetical protein MUP46_03040 [Patescibacteria group bacterium]|nr:hypothetical protein [Patescibacteria group bacterium]